MCPKESGPLRTERMNSEVREPVSGNSNPVAVPGRTALVAIEINHIITQPRFGQIVFPIHSYAPSDFTIVHELGPLGICLVAMEL